MNASIYPLPCSSAMPVAVGYTATIKEIETVDGKLVFRIATSPEQQEDECFSAMAAESLLLIPKTGDLVLCIRAEAQWFVTQILQRAEPDKALTIHSLRPVEWSAPSLRFKAFHEMELLSANRLTLSARDVITGASRTLIQQAQHVIQKATTFSLNVKGLMQLTGKQQVIVAEEDLRMDGKRINMG